MIKKVQNNRLRMVVQKSMKIYRNKSMKELIVLKALQKEIQNHKVEQRKINLQKLLELSRMKNKTRAWEVI